MNVRQALSQGPLLALGGAAVLALGLLQAGQANAAQPTNAPPAPSPQQFPLLSGDRVVLLGDGFMARELALGYLETRLTLQYPEHDVRFRNLGWISPPPLSGTSAEPGTSVETLKESLAAFKPTVAVIAYGTDAGAATNANGSPFLAQYEQLLGSVQQAAGSNKVRFLLLGPVRPEPPAAPALNGSLAVHSSAIQGLAARRGALFVSLSNLMGQLPRYGVTNRVTEDGLHLTAQGYRLISDLLAPGLAWEANLWRVGVLADGRFRNGGYGIQATHLEKSANHVRFTGMLEQLPSPAVLQSNRPLSGLGPSGMMQFVGLAPTNYALKVDGQMVKNRPDSLWRRGEPIEAGPDYDQAEQLRQAIVKKNELVRRRAQLKKRDEAPDLDRLITEQEQAIARLRKPVKRIYELVPAAPARSIEPATCSATPWTPSGD